MGRDRHLSRASFACVRCKKDKRRCDISQIPNDSAQVRSCTACRNKKEKCEVRYGEDKRSNRQSSDAKVLHKRIEALEQLIRNSATPRDDGQSNSQQKKQTTFPSPTNSFSPTSQRRSESITDSDNRGTWPETLLPEQSMENISDRFPPAMDEVTPPSENGRGQACGNDHYLGSVSLFPYSERYTSSIDAYMDVITPEEESNRRSCASLETSPEPEPIIVHLLDLFWEFQASHLLVVDRDIFLHHRKIWDESGGNGDRNFYTPCLLYSILSLASMISPDRGVKKYSASPGTIPGERFCKRARALFELEMEHPTITTVQAALVLGSRYGAMVDNSLGWTYSGIAFRIASKLGLHLDCSRVVASGQMSPQMAELRRTVFWGCHNEDNLFSTYCGRPTFFMEWDITIPVPDPPLNLPSPNNGHLSPFLSHTTATLSCLCSKILVNLYGQRHHCSSEELSAVASKVHRDLWQWHQSLPEDLKWSTDGSSPLTPQVFVLHMDFYFTLILLHRPFLQFSQVLHDLNHWDDSTLNSTTTCAIAAANIIKLVANYQQSYKIEQVPSPVVHVTFIAGTIHLVNFRLAKADTHHRLLQRCMVALSAMGDSYPIAHKAASVLQELTERWKPSNETNEPEYSQQIRREVSSASDSHDTQAIFDPLAIKVPPLAELDGLLDIEANGHISMEDFSFMPSSDNDIYDQLMLGQAGYNSSLMRDITGPMSDRALFDTIYGNACPLTSI